MPDDSSDDLMGDLMHDRSDIHDRSDDRDGRGAGRRPGRTGRRVRRVVGGLVLTYLVVLAVCAVVGALALLEVRHDAQRARAAYDGGDVAGAVSAGRSAITQLDRAGAVLSGPQWRPVTALPLIGDDVGAALLTVVSADHAADALEPALAPAQQVLTGVRRADGSVDTELLSRLARALRTADGPVSQAAADVATINPAGVVGPLRGPLTKATDAVTTLAQGTSSAADAAQVATVVLGADGPRTTLVAVQNPAEARGTGGIIGAFTLIRADRGRVKVEGAGVNDDLAGAGPAASAIPPQVLALYGPGVTDVRNLNLSPDFTVAAPLVLQTYRQHAQRTGGPAVPADALLVTVTPRALGLAIGATGPITLPGSTKQITASSAVAFFGNDVYRLIPGQHARNTYVQTALRSVVGRLLSPDVDAAGLLSAVRGASGSRDLMAWAPDTGTESAIGRLAAGGGLGDARLDVARVSLVSADASKLDYFDRVNIRLGAAGCPLSVTVRNTAPADPPAYVVAQVPLAGQPATTHTVVVQVHLPGGVGVRRVTVDGRPVGFAAGPEKGWNALRITLVVPRQRTAGTCLDLTGRRLSRVVAPVLSVPATVDPPSAVAH